MGRTKATLHRRPGSSSRPKRLNPASALIDTHFTTLPARDGETSSADDPAGHPQTTLRAIRRRPCGPSARRRLGGHPHADDQMCHPQTTLGHLLTLGHPQTTREEPPADDAGESTDDHGPSADDHGPSARRRPLGQEKTTTEKQIQSSEKL